MREAARFVINGWDPIGLLDMGAPENEYDSEISALLPVITKAENAEELAVEIKRIFVQAFDANTFRHAEAQCLDAAERLMKIKR